MALYGALALLDIVQEFCKRRGLPVPATVIGNQDDTVVQILGLLNEGIAEITDRAEWPVLQIYYTFHHRNTPAGDTVALDLRELNQNLPDFGEMLNYTLWDTTSNRQVAGPLDPRQWMELLTLRVSQAVYHYSFWGRDLRIYPVPTVPASTPFTMIYGTRYAVQDVVNVAGPETYTAMFMKDTDIPRFPSRIMLADLRWRWAAEKGLPYAEYMRMSEGFLMNWLGRAPQPDITLDCPDESMIGPQLLVPAGTWRITP